MADKLGADCVALVVGSGVEGIAAELGAYGAMRVMVVDDPALARHSSSAYAKVIANGRSAEGSRHGVSSRHPDGKRPCSTCCREARMPALHLTVSLCGWRMAM